MKFRMVDQILEWEPGRRIRALKAVSFEEYDLRSALGMGEYLPESLALASLVEAGSWLVMLSSQYARLATASEIERAEFGVPLRPGRRMVLEVELEEDSRMAGRGVTEAGELVVAAEWSVEYQDLSRYSDPDDLAILFSEIHRPMMGASV